LSDGVNSAVEGVKALALQTMVDRIGPQAQRDQLSSSYHAVLLLRQARNRLIVTPLSFAANFAVKVILVAHAA
jgi:hypothetical protein